MSLRSDLIDAGIVDVAKAAKAMRQSHISLIPKPDYALTDKDGIPRLGVDDVARIVLDAAIAFLTEHLTETVHIPHPIALQDLDIDEVLDVLSAPINPEAARTSRQPDHRLITTLEGEALNQ